MSPRDAGACCGIEANDEFKPRLAQEIRQRDALLLFWSRNAAASPWVKWELDTARGSKDAQAVVAMPLEEPSTRTAAEGFEGLHLRDRFLPASYGLAKTSETVQSNRKAR